MIPMYMTAVPPPVVMPGHACQLVMPVPGLDPGICPAIHVLYRDIKDVDGPNKSGHDDRRATGAAAFIDSLGVNTHIDFRAHGYQNLATVEKALRYLGVRNVRDSAQNANDALWWPAVSHATGVKFDDYIPETSPAGMRTALGFVPQLAREGVLSFIEGGNEEDDPYPVSLGNSQHIAAQFQKQVWALGQSLGLPVINISFGAGWTAKNNWQGNYATVGDLSASATYGNAHVYPVLGQTPDYALTRLNGLARLAASTRPVIITEIGWDTNAVDPVTAAKYTLDAAMDGFRNGNPKTYFYALFDDSSGKFGLMNADGTAKPAGRALHNLIRLMSDTGADAGSLAPKSLGYTLSGSRAGDSSLLFEKSDGSTWLALWNEKQPPDRHHDVTLALDRRSASVTRFDPLTGTTPTDTWKGVASATIAVPDHPVLIEIVPTTAALSTVPARRG